MAKEKPETIIETRKYLTLSADSIRSRSEARELTAREDLLKELGEGSGNVPEIVAEVLGVFDLSGEARHKALETYAYPLSPALGDADTPGIAVSDTPPPDKIVSEESNETIDPDAFDDIRSVTDASHTFYYSEASLSDAYALHLARVRSGSPVHLIAETVRDNSRIYPRPTPVAFFGLSPFGMSAEMISRAIESIKTSPEYDDIRECRTRRTTLYLYSDRFMPEAQAAYLAEWEETGEEENP